MVTLRAFSNQAEAALAKSVLDEHNITCTLADENVNLWTPAQFVMPVRILVAEEQAEEAARILDEGGRNLPDAERIPGREATDERKARDNPWELLAIAFMVALPSGALLLQKHDLISQVPRRVTWMSGPVYGRITRANIWVISSASAHLIGFLLLVAALLLVVLYVYLRRIR